MNTLPGLPHPLGATMRRHGVNFSLFSKHAKAVELLLFDSPTAKKPTHSIPLDPHNNRTFYYWHVFVPGLEAGQLYGYRVHGPDDPANGHRFDAQKVLVDPYAHALCLDTYEREAARRPGDNLAHAIKSAVVDARGFDWNGDTPLRLSYASSVIYELHVGGFTKHPNSGLPPTTRGTYAGMIEKIPYLQALGVTTVELLPVQQFDEQDLTPPRTNYWGYNPIGFFAPHGGYSSDKSLLGPVNEFRELVKALHKASIEVIVDVVFNHTAEGDATGPMLSFRGLENRAYYLLQHDKAQYANYSGCGNSVNANQSVTRRLIMDCLRYWVEQMHVDGFRFDLASALARDEEGRPLANPPILWDIESDPVLAGTKIIAEAWDAAGLYQVGSFIGDRWAEWNGRYRDEVRRFVKSDEGMVPKLAARLIGSPDIYAVPDRDLNRSINFITAHDGFTLNDLVSYNTKHNDANGEDNRDGTNDNYSWNCGVEGPTTDAAIEALRVRQIKNFITILMLSRGTPMLLMGDEVRRTLLGNNNAYCHDTPQNWFDWSALEKHASLQRFMRGLIRFNWLHDTLPLNVVWHGIEVQKPDWGDASRSLAMSLRTAEGDDKLYAIFNAYWEPLEFALPPLSNGLAWHRLADTALPSPADFAAPETEPRIPDKTYRAEARSVVVLVAKPL